MVNKSEHLPMKRFLVILDNENRLSQNSLLRIDDFL